MKSKVISYPKKRRSIIRNSVQGYWIRNVIRHAGTIEYIIPQKTAMELYNGIRILTETGKLGPSTFQIYRDPRIDQWIILIE